MPTLEIFVKDFAGAFIGLNGNKILNVSKNRLRKFAFSIGLPIHAAATSNSQHAVMFAAYKAQAIKCTVDFSKPSLGHFAEYVHLDPSEKVNLSYWTGMTLAALVADEVLGVSRLVHAAAIGGPKLKKKNPKSKSLADLIGQDHALKWHVVEAKARQNDPSSGDLIKWKTQATTIKTINGVKPSTESYALTKVTPTYTVTLVDPPGDDSGLNIELEDGAILDCYYTPIINFLGEDSFSMLLDAGSIIRENANLRVKLLAFDAMDLEYVFIGMTERAILDVLGGRLPVTEEARDLPDVYIGSDGVVVFTSKTPNLE